MRAVTSDPAAGLGHLLGVQVLRGALVVVGVGAIAALLGIWLERRGAGMAERTDGAAEPPGRRRLRLIFGVLWLLAGVLQFQPEMPGAFVPVILGPGLNTSPSWLTGVVRPLAEVWVRHPINADAAAAWIQIGLGVLLLSGVRGMFGRMVLLISIAWGLLVWVAGEFLGGLTLPAASSLRGSPGAALAYVAAAILLLLPYRWWETGRAGRLARRVVGVWLLLGAFLQALPWEGWWGRRALAQLFTDAAASPQPAPLTWPMHVLQSISTRQPVVLNAVLVVMVAAVGISLLPHRAWRPGIIAGFVVLAASWWFGQDFGVLQSAATDPNSGLPLMGLLAAGWPAAEPAVASAQAPAEIPVETPAEAPAAAAVAATVAEEEASAPVPAAPIAAPAAAPKRPSWVFPLSAGAVALGLCCLVALPATLLPGLAGPADSASAVADSGGVLALQPFPVPSFSLTDQSGRRVTTADLHGHWTVLTFLDSVCSDNCPVIANQLAAMDRSLGPLADRVQILAINTNPVFSNVRDVATFTTEHRLTDLPNWHFLTGPPASLQAVMAQFQVSISIPVVGMLSHTQGVVFVGPDGNQEAYIQDAANPLVTQGYAALVHDELVRRLS